MSLTKKLFRKITLGWRNVGYRNCVDHLSTMLKLKNEGIRLEENYANNDNINEIESVLEEAIVVVRGAYVVEAIMDEWYPLSIFGREYGTDFRTFEKAHEKLCEKLASLKPWGEQ